MNSFLHHISAIIERERLLEPCKPVLVGVSGGADSVCLLHVLVSLGYNVRVVHCNFHLRGDESERDMAFVEELCREMGVWLDVVHFDVASHCKQHGVSVEMACRDLRYREFSRLKEEHGCQAIAVAHHADDNAETMFLNMLRGTGIAGISGMRYRSDANVVRPLLELSRMDIETYCADNGLRFVVDSTNSDIMFKRNRVRHKVLPLLEKLFPGASDAITTTLSNLRDNLALYNEAVEAKRLRYVHDGGIDVAEIVANERNPRVVLHELLYPLGFTNGQISDVLKSCSRSGGVYEIAGVGRVYNLSHGKLVKIEDANDCKPLNFSDFDSIIECCDVQIVPMFMCREQFKPGRDNKVAYFSADAFPENAHWQLRRWQKGDRIKPFGMGGRSRLVSDIMRDAHYNEQQKQSALMLLCNNEIVWAVGLKTSNKFTVTPQTQHILRLTQKKVK